MAVVALTGVVYTYGQYVSMYWEFALNPDKDNTGLKARRYLYAPMEYDGKIAVVKITVKEYADTDLQNKLYSIEAIDVDLRA